MFRGGDGVLLSAAARQAFDDGKILTIRVGQTFFIQEEGAYRRKLEYEARLKAARHKIETLDIEDIEEIDYATA